MKPKERLSIVHRVLAQLQKAEPDYLHTVASFLFNLWGLQETNNLISVRVLRTDGIQVNHAEDRVFYMHVDRSSWALLLLRSNDLLAKQPKLLCRFSEQTTGSHDLQYRISDAREFGVIIRFLKSLRKERFEAHDKQHSRLIPAEVQELVWERFERNGRICENPRCPNRGRSYNQFAWHLDHTLPFSRGGSSVVPNNLRVLCAPCNLRKSSRFEAFMYYLD